MKKPSGTLFYSTVTVPTLGLAIDCMATADARGNTFATWLIPDSAIVMPLWQMFVDATFGVSVFASIATANGFVTNITISLGNANVGPVQGNLFVQIPMHSNMGV